MVTNPVSRKRYAAAVASGEVAGPSVATLTKRFGTWTAACAAAGVSAGPTMRPTYESRWTDDDLLRLVARSLADQTVPKSLPRFEAWRYDHEPHGRSTEPLRVRFGTWEDAKREAFKILPTLPERESDA